MMIRWVAILLFVSVSSAAPKYPLRHCAFKQITDLSHIVYETDDPSLIGKLKGSFPKTTAVRITSDDTRFNIEVLEGKKRIFVGSGELRGPERSMLDLELNLMKGNYQDKGLSRIVMAWALKRFPDINRFPAAMMDDNLNAIKIAMTQGRLERDQQIRLSRDMERNRNLHRKIEKQFLSVVEGLNNKQAVETFRAQMMEAFFSQTPAGRIRREAGFENIEQITVSLDEGDGNPIAYVDFDVSKGPQKKPPVLILDDIRGNKIKTIRWSSAGVKSES